MIYKILLSISFLISLSSLASAQGNWELMFPSPTSNQMVGMYFIDDQNGWSVGEYGTILKTTDGGENWTIQEIPCLFDLCDVHFPTALTGYAVGTDGFIIKTTDGGESWEQLDNRYINNLNRILFRDENNGWAIGEKGLILHTSDSGATWALQPSNTNITLNGIDFIGRDGVIIVGEHGTILISHDEGQNWQIVPDDPLFSHFYSFEDVYFVDELHGWIGGGTDMYTALLKTIDGGQTWTWIEDIEGSFRDFSTFSGSFPYLGPLQQIYFYDDMKTGIGLLKACHLRDLGNIAMKTTDGGRSWTCVMWGSFEDYDGRGRFCVLENSKIICTGYHGAFRFSTDKGREWHLSADDQRWCRDLTIRDNGQLLAYKYSSRPNFPRGDVRQFARSSDYGMTWSDFEPAFLDSNGYSLDTANFSEFKRKLGDFVNNQDTLWAILNFRPRGETNYRTSIFFSEDFGCTYKELGKLNHPFHTFLTPDTLISYGVGSYEKAPGVWEYVFAFRSSFDRGATMNYFESTDVWNFLSFGSTDFDLINAHYFFNSRKGFLVGTDGNIVKTEDTGQSWVNIYSGVVEDLYDITFIDEQTGFVVGNFGRILKTVDGGMIWRKTDSGTQEDVYSVGFVNNHEGWVSTENGLRYTTDAGETWQGVPLRYAHGSYENLVFDNAGNGYAFTLGNQDRFPPTEYPDSYKQLIRMKTNAIGIREPKSETLAPHAITLFQNYPNPFNATTTIRFQIPQSKQVSITVFDILGYQVSEITNRLYEAGSHQILWEGKNQQGQAIASGLYIYRIEVGDFVQCNKMLLLK